jgi:hypothetical protein
VPSPLEPVPGAAQPKPNVRKTLDTTLAAATKALRPTVNIIIVTGYSAPKSDEIPPGSLFVSKPYNAREMIEAVRHFQ